MLPLALYLGIDGKGFQDEHYIAPFTAYYILTDSIVYANFAINFYLYVAFTTSFRKTVKGVLKAVVQKCCGSSSMGTEGAGSGISVTNASIETKRTEFSQQHDLGQV